MKYLEFFLASIVLAIVALFGGNQNAQAQQSEGRCMEEVAGFGLNCTANDVQIAGVAKNPDGTPMLQIEDDGCAYPGDTVTFTATFDVVVSATERYDIGIYFATDGDLNHDGALTGGCVAAILPPASSVDLDKDLCGDITKASNPLRTTIKITTKCIDPDSDGYLNLPYCTSWRQSGANTVCNSPSEAFPGAPSKCRCDMGFNVPIEVPAASLRVTKTPSPSSVPEPGATVSYSVSVSNTGIDPANTVTLASLVDGFFGDITKVQGNITETTCSVGGTIAINTAYTCAFNAKVSGNAYDVVPNDPPDGPLGVLTASGVDTRGNNIKGTAHAYVDISNVLPKISVGKTATPTSIVEPGGEVTFTVAVTNKSVKSDPVTIKSLTDDIYGDLNGKGTCSTGVTIEPSGTYVCEFTDLVSGNNGAIHTDVVTANVVDDDNYDDTASWSATVSILDSPSSIELVKTASPTEVNEPGGAVTFTVTVNNLSAADWVTINSLIDSLYGDITKVQAGGITSTTCSVNQTMAPSGSYSCSFTAFVQQKPGQSQTSVVTASGVDDDGNSLSASHNSTVTVKNLLPTAKLTKTPVSALVTYKVVITNTSSAADTLVLDSLRDDVYGDLTDTSDEGGTAKVQESTTCQKGISILPGESYACEFTALVPIADSPEEDTVWAELYDEELYPVSPAPAGKARVTLETFVIP